MMKKLYWTFRLFAYAASLVGIFIYLYHQVDADSTVRNFGLGLVGIGCVSFFISYALRVWIRVRFRRSRDEA